MTVVNKVFPMFRMNREISMFFTMFSNIPRSVYKRGPNGTLFKIVALVQTRRRSVCGADDPCPNLLKGVDYIRDPSLNKGLAFTIEERQALGIHGLLAAKYHTQKDQLAFCTIAFDRYISDLNKYIYLIELQDTNEKLFFSLISQNPDKYLPIVYTPTVGLACQRFGLIHRRTRGLFLTINDKGHLYDVVRNWPETDVRAIVFTDGERILGLGDLGAYGMGIPVGKLALYTALAGIPPHQCLPVVLDVGTDNKELLQDPLYIGLRHKRVRGKPYDDLIEEFFEACLKRFGPNTLMQFEDFALVNAARLLEKYRDRACTFNDDIQGTASVALAGLFAASRITEKRNLKDNTFFFFGAGSAATGIAGLVRQALIQEGLSEKEAIERIYMFDINGIITTKRNEGVPETSKLFGRDLEPNKDLENCIAKYKPTCLIGCSTVGGSFTPAILKTMAKNSKRPVVFALSNPTSKAECTAQAAYDNTEGRVVFASGSPFPPVKYNGKEYKTGQGNNAYIFPGIALGVIAASVRRIPETMFLEAARILAESVKDEDLQMGRIYPSLNQIRDVSVKIAIGMANLAYKEGIATMFPKPDNIKDCITQCIYSPDYVSCLPKFYNYPPLPDHKLKSVEELYRVTKYQDENVSSCCCWIFCVYKMLGNGCNVPERKKHFTNRGIKQHEIAKKPLCSV